MNLLVTGGTGFFGRALIRHLDAERITHGKLPFSQITILSRDPARFRSMYPQLGNLPWITWHTGDVLTPDSLPKESNYEYILHAATDSTDSANLTPLKQFHQIVRGTENMLRFASRSDTHRFLLTSSGGAYGPQPGHLTEIPENYSGMPDPLSLGNVYGIAKRQAEHLCCLYGHQYGIETVIARCFAFVGEDLPLNAHFAIGNFIRDAIGLPVITVQGDGTPLRSYLHQEDLARWLLALLCHGQAGTAYNVGSDQAISIKDLAYLIRDILAPSKQVHIKGGGEGTKSDRNRYVPCINKIRTELQLDVQILLPEAIKKTAETHQSQAHVEPSKQ